MDNRAADYARIHIDWGKSDTLQFIEDYRQHPCLWQVRSPAYKDRIAKVAALHDLLRKTRVKFPSLNMIDIKRKINTIRTQFRREINNLTGAKKSVTSVDEACHPKLWCFPALSFLAEEGDLTFDLGYSAEQDNHDSSTSEPVSNCYLCIIDMVH